jgi:hypothetical protein
MSSDTYYDFNFYLQFLICSNKCLNEWILTQEKHIIYLLTAIEVLEVFFQL